MYIFSHVCLWNGTSDILNALLLYRFEGISWNCDETLIAYIAEEPLPFKPMFSGLGYKKGSASTDKDSGSWKGQGEWEEDWGETYAGKRQPALFVMSTSRCCTSDLCYPWCYDKVRDCFSCYEQP